MNPFSKDYTPKIDAKSITQEAQISRNATKTRAKMQASSDPTQRFVGSGFVPGMSTKSMTRADKSNSKV